MKERLVCVDSDGCVIDSMEIKHRRCFGPCLVEVWHLERWEEPILKRWNQINLYENTRGINRFLGLEKILTFVNQTYCPIEGLQEYRQWCQKGEKRMPEGGIFDLARIWSDKVNLAIAEISGLIRPFEGAKEALAYLSQKADVAVVSSANREAIMEEWERFGLLPYVCEIFAQDSGSKAQAIALMLSRGYAKEKALMIGDAPGDKRAAQENGIAFYPIIAGKENESWRNVLNL